MQEKINNFLKQKKYIFKLHRGSFHTFVHRLQPITEKTFIGISLSNEH